MIVKIWDVVEGPISVEESPDEAPEGANWYMVCKTEVDGEMSDDNFWFEEFNDAYEWKKHFMKTIEPLVIDMNAMYGYN
tara:strand:- start:642 stop:878 length:237 start_codon:yes stop_codon:yes gene_type:complete